VVRNENILFDTAYPDFIETKFEDSVWDGIAEELNFHRW
jgi:hypothetical protein